MINLEAIYLNVSIINDDISYCNELKKTLLELPEIIMVTTADSVENFLANPNLTSPDVILLDVKLPGMDGISGIVAIKAKYPQTEIIMLTAFSSDETVFLSFYYGAIGFILKGESVKKIRDAVVLSARGESFITTSIARKVVNYFASLQSNVSKLTLREKQVVAAIVDGLSYKLIADRLNVRTSTIQGYIKSIYKKLDVHSKTEVIMKVTKKFI